MYTILQGITVSNNRDTVYYRDIYESYQKLILSHSPDMIFQRERNSVTESSFFVRCNQKTKDLFTSLARSVITDPTFYVSFCLNVRNYF